MNPSKISCVIPVYNELSRVSKVLKAVVGHPLINEVIVVDDGSTDGSKELLQNTSGIQLISYQSNRGKSHAVMRGIKRAHHDYILMLDSDLVGLSQADVTALVKPVLEGQAEVSMSLRGNDLRIYKILGIDFVTGERMFNKNIISDLDELDYIPPFALESFLNKIVVQKQLKIKVVLWPHVTQTLKSIKMSYWAGLNPLSSWCYKS